MNPISKYKKKRLGQYMTDYKLAKLLVSLAQADKCTKVIDPMCGTGNMLKAVNEVNSKCEIYGIEIDNDVFADAKKNLNASIGLLSGDAFSSRTYKSIPKKYDLVVANPPYVRYQESSVSTETTYAPSATNVRSNLMKTVDVLVKNTKEKDVWMRLIEGYSGLSDLAVPSWILLAMLTEINGTIALVVPESWLKRDYADIISYMLLRFFKISYIVEDINACWFSKASIKTNLIIAKRTTLKSTAFGWKDEEYKHVGLSKESINDSSMVGNIFPNARNPEGEFITKVNDSSFLDTNLFTVRAFRISNMARNLKSSSSAYKWLPKFENQIKHSDKDAFIPMELRHIIGNRNTSFNRLDELAIRVGQGLRTGANPFFYLELLSEQESISKVKGSNLFDNLILNLDRRYLLPTVRRQSDLEKSKFSLRTNTLQSRLLYINKNATISDELQKYILLGESIPYRDTRIPQLSAVRTNNPWYSIPDLQRRHIPDLFLPRVNNMIPKTYLNKDTIVIDANFTTLWIEDESKISAYCLLSFLNSSWSQVYMELVGAIMGGGALKLEATHLKKIPVPFMSKDVLNQLDKAGRDLIKKPEKRTLELIDRIVLENIFNKSEIASKALEIKSLLNSKYLQRNSSSNE